MKNLKLQYIFTLSVTVLYLCCFLLTSLEHQWALWIQPSISADLGRHGFARKAMPMWEVWWRRWVGGHLGAVPDSLTDFWVASMKTFDLLEFTCLFNRPAFSIFAVICMHMKNKKTAFSTNCPVAWVITWAICWGPSLGKCPAAVKGTLPTWQMGNTETGLTRICALGAHRSAFVLINTELMMLGLYLAKSASVLRDAPWKCVPGG